MCLSVLGDLVLARTDEMRSRDGGGLGGGEVGLGIRMGLGVGMAFPIPSPSSLLPINSTTKLDGGNPAPHPGQTCLCSYRGDSGVWGRHENP
jgi:hypothetical protein